MQFMTWGINRPGIKEKRAALNETHWAFWDAYEGRLIARGPVLDADGTSPLGSIHIAELGGFDEAKVMAYDEPYAAADLFQDLILTRFQSDLDRTQFDTPPRPGKLGFFLYCKSSPDAAGQRDKLADEHEAYCRALDDDMVVCRGSLLTDDGTWTGSAFFIEVDDPALAETFLEKEPYNAAGLFEETRLVRWRRGGRANAPGK